METITTMAGNGTFGHSGDGGPATSASLGNPSGLDVDAAGNVYVAEHNAHYIRKISADGTITTVVRNGPSDGVSGDGGPALNASIGFPTSVAVDSDGNIYVAADLRVRKVSPAGIITTLTGGGASSPGDGGPATSAYLFGPGQVAVLRGNLYIAESLIGRIRRVNPAGTISTIAGADLANFSGDGGPGSSAALSLPYGLTLDAAGNIYFADTFNNRIRKVALDGRITTVAGTGQTGFSGDGGPAISARIDHPLGVAVDASGNIYIPANARIRKMHFAVFPLPETAPEDKSAAHVTFPGEFLPC